MKGGDKMIFDLSPNEQIIMDYFWERNEWLSGANMWEYFNKIGKAYDRSTVNTYLARMTDKGLLKKDKRKYIHAFTKEQLEQKKAEYILDTMYDGSLSKFLSALGGSKYIDTNENEELKEYLKNIE